jgi:hypothetical protein
VTLVLHLDNQKDADLLAFLLDTTIEKWKEEQEGQQAIIASDPELLTLEALVEATGGYAEMVSRLGVMRNNLYATMKNGQEV